MNLKTIKYIGFYDTQLYEFENRNLSLAAINKMDYIAKTIVNLGKKVDIISPSWTANENGYYNKRTISLDNNISLTCSSTFGAEKKILKGIRVLISWIWLFCYLVKNISRNEEIIVYHSMMIMFPVMFAKKIKGFSILLEVEEIYQDVVKFPIIMEKNEYKFFEIADKYLFSTELLNKKINISNKPYALIYGTYQTEEFMGHVFDDRNIHIVYAGTLDPKKGGAIAAAAAEYLPKNYHVHIIGFGNVEEKKLIMEKISEISYRSEAIVTYDGILKGEQYSEFLQKCHIGLSTQMPGSAFNETSFPSKILSYMANGLRVVSVRIKAVELSAIGNAVYYYDESTPRAIANAIMAIDFNEKYDSRALIRKLDKKFTHEIKKLLEN